MQGKLVVIDGLDAAGKTLMVKKLKSHLEKKLGKGKVLLTAEPSKSPFGKKLRALLKRERNPKKGAKKFLDLYVKDRAFHLRKEIVPALKRGKIVLCDRYKYSTIVYQSVQGVSVKEILKLHRKMLVPDLVLIFDISPKTSLKRIASSKREGFDTFEQEKFLQSARKKFLALPKLLPKENIKIINAAGTKKEVFSFLKKEVEKVLL